MGQPNTAVRIRALLSNARAVTVETIPSRTHIATITVEVKTVATRAHARSFQSPTPRVPANRYIANATAKMPPRPKVVDDPLSRLTVGSYRIDRRYRDTENDHANHRADNHPSGDYADNFRTFGHGGIISGTSITCDRCCEQAIPRPVGVGCEPRNSAYTRSALR
jgi:hypothetical protein